MTKVDNPVGNGALFEKEVLGHYADFTIFPQYVTRNLSIRNVLNKQPAGWNPGVPSTVLGNKLLETAKLLLLDRLKSMHLSEELAISIVSTTGLYVAIGTAVDFYHGTDAIIACDLENFFPYPPYEEIDLKSNNFKNVTVGKNGQLILTRNDFENLHSNKALGRLIDRLAKSILDFFTWPK